MSASRVFIYFSARSLDVLGLYHSWVVVAFGYVTAIRPSTIFAAVRAAEDTKIPQITEQPV